MKSRRKFTSAFKTKVVLVLEALMEQATLSELSTKYQLEASQITKWKEEFLEKSTLLFELKEPKKTSKKETQKLYGQIGRLNIQIEFLKKSCRKT